jgi:uncharacterized protein (TIGR00251 family)
MASAIVPTTKGVILRLHIQPRASRTAFAGYHGERLKLSVTSPPVDGKANAEVIRFVAKVFDLKRHQVELVRGEKSRQKDVLLSGCHCPSLSKLIRTEQ